MKIGAFKTLVCATLLGCMLRAYSQQVVVPDRDANRSHPWSIKTDLMGFRSHSISLEGEAFLLWRVSAFVQVGIIQGYRHDSPWRSHGYIGRAGLKYYLGSMEAPRMTGFALRLEAATRTWHSHFDEKTHDQKDVAGFFGISYTWNPFDRFVVEPCFGVGMASWEESFSEPNILDGPSGIPNTPWIQVQPGKFYRGEGVYDLNGDLMALRGTAPQISVGLLVGIRL